MITTESVIKEPAAETPATPTVASPESVATTTEPAAEAPKQEVPTFIEDVEHFLSEVKRGVINSTEESLKHINNLLSELKARL